METIGIHPTAILLNRDIYFWGRKRTYFYKYFLEKKEIKELRARREIYFEEKDFYFKCLLEDGYSLEQIVNIRFETNQRKKRLNKKLKELNLNYWDVKIYSHINFLKAVYNSIEIFNESFNLIKKNTIE